MVSIYWKIEEKTDNVVMSEMHWLILKEKKLCFKFEILAKRADSSIFFSVVVNRSFLCCICKIVVIFWSYVNEKENGSNPFRYMKIIEGTCD